METACVLALGRNDGGQAWLHGESIWDRPQGRSLSGDEDQIPIRLKRGKNPLLLKIEERGNQWGFCVRLLELDIPKLIERSSLFTVVNDPNGAPVLRFLEPAWLAKEILNEVAIEVFS